MLPGATTERWQRAAGIDCTGAIQLELGPGDARVKQEESYSLAALGKVGTFTVEVLSKRDGGWLLSVQSPAWCFDFALAGPAAVGELAAFFRSHAGRTGFSELVIGSFGAAAVRVVKCDEFADRFFLRAAGGGALVEFTLTNQAAEEFAAAVAEADGEFATQAEPGDVADGRA